MKVPNTKIENVCANKYDARAYLRVPYLDVERKRLVSTNGHALAIVEVELDDGDTAGHVPIEALKAVRKDKSAVSIYLDGAAKVNGTTFPREDLGKYPEYSAVLPERPEREPDITFNAELLFNLSRAICTGKWPFVSLWITDDEKGVYVETAGGGYGVIMPARAAGRAVRS